MKPTKELLDKPKADSVLISLHPKHAQKILSGEKKLEFRRVWPSRDIQQIVVYATVPVQKIVAICSVRRVHSGTPTALWRLAKAVGGGLTRKALYDYFRGKKAGYAIEIDEVKIFNPCLEAKDFLSGFKAPQSYCYLDTATVEKLEVIRQSRSKTGTVIFVSGVHGVGKTTLCEQFVMGRDFVHKSASQLIREERECAIRNDSKAVVNIPGNQELLLQAVKKIREKGQNLLLDGHFVLLNAESQITPIDADVFKGLDLSGVVVVQDRPEIIAARQGRRDGSAFSPDFLEALQEAEVNHAELIANGMSIPIVKVQGASLDLFQRAVSAVSRGPVSEPSILLRELCT